jgi:hypothetical protein
VRTHDSQHHLAKEEHRDEVENKAKVEYEGGADPKTMRCSRWRTVPSVVRAEPPRDGFGASLRDGMERRGARARFYSPKAVPRKEGEDLEGKF